MSKKKKRRHSKENKNIKLMPVYIVSAVVPLIVYMKRIKLEGILYTTWKGYEEYGDFFSYYKAVGIMVIALVSVLLIINRVKKYPIEMRRYTDFIPAAIYMLCIIISTFLSEYFQVALYGYNERYEGGLVLISYLVICFYTAYFIESEEEIKRVVVFLGISCSIIGLIGLFQYFGMDLFQTEVGIKLIFPPKYYQYADNLKFSFNGNIISSTLYNPNYVGSYSAMLLFISIGTYYTAKKIWVRIVVGLFFCGSAFVLWVGSMSRAGLLGGSVGSFIFLILQLQNIIRNWKYSMPLGVYFLSIYLILNGFSGGRVITEFDRINPVMEEQRIEERKEILYIDEIKTEANSVIVGTTTETLKIEKSDGDINFSDEQGLTLETEYKDNIYYFDGESYAKYKFRILENNYFALYISKYIIKLRYVDNQFKFVTVTGEEIDIKNAEILSILKGREAFASGRGFLWSRTFPMLKNIIIKGYGPDTYTIYFPQWDLAGKINGLNDPNRIVDTPHNWYLQVAVDTGVISLIALIIFIFLYLYRTLTIYFKTEQRHELVFQSALFASVISYCIAGFFNDSVVSVAPVFWVLLGLGIALNRIKYNQIGN